VPARHRKRIASSQDVFPTEEQVDRHIRQVHPGNHKTKLRPETISELNKTFGATMAFFGYE
jgi:hypothetical protein